MIKLNLLPPEQKKQIYLERINRWLVFYMASFCAILSGFFLVLLFIYALISIESRTAQTSYRVAQTGSQGQDLSSYEKLAQNFNQELEKVRSIQKNHKNYSLLFEKLLPLVPLNIRFDSIQINANGKIMLTGFAYNREQIIEFKENLENSKDFSNVESPISNLVKQSNIDFSLVFNFNPEMLKK